MSTLAIVRPAARLLTRIPKRSLCGGLERTELRGALPEQDHLRGGLGGVAPMHLNVDSRIVHGFRWVACGELVEHEAVRLDKASALEKYLETQGSYATIPAIIACSRTNTIIDGHHRHKVATGMGFSVLPVLYIDYGHHDVLVHDDPGCLLKKQDVVDSALSGNLLAPKSTKHVVRAGDGSLHPIVSLSPNAGLMHQSTNLTGGWSYKPVMKKLRQAEVGVPPESSAAESRERTGSTRATSQILHGSPV